MMKNVLFIISLISCVFMSSCSTTEPGLNLDNSLAGSISFEDYGYYMEIDGSYDVIPLGIEESVIGLLETTKLSETTIRFWLTTPWKDKRLTILMPEIPVEGKPYEATLDHTSTDAQITYDGVELNPESATIKAWITEPTYSRLTREPVMPRHKYEINIDFTFSNGEELQIFMKPSRAY